jgi:D-arabinitol dehydrogenase (NADP+)
VRAVVFSAPHRWDLAEVPIPEPGPGQVLLRVLRTGVCGTDLHLLAGGFLARFPLIPGHEIVGAVAAWGEGVTGPPVGTAVAVDNTVLCGVCGPCRRGTPLYCRDFHSLGVTDPGGFAEYLVAAAGTCFPLDGLTPEVAVLTEPLACAVHGADVLALRPGSDVLVLGAGPTGLLLSQLLLHGGAARLTVAAPSPHKLDLARFFGVDATVRLDRVDPGPGLERLRAAAPEGYDAVVEATGAPHLLAAAPALTRTGGTVLVYGMADEAARVPLSPYEIFARELTVRGSFAQVHCFERAMLALRTGRVRTEGIVTDPVPLDGFAAALAAVADSRSVKAVVLA